MKLVLLLLIIWHQHIQCFVGAFYGVCSLQSVPIENITLPYNYDNGDEANNRHRRLFLRGPAMNAIVLTSHGARTTNNQRRTHSSSSSSNFDREISAGVNLQIVESRLCDPRLCVMNYHQSQIYDEFYCPVPTNYCTVIQSPYDKNVSITCSYYQGWKVLFVRSTWYYICWITVLFTVLFCCTPAGHHAIRYPISRCFSKFNNWVTGHLLQAEISSRNQIRNEYEEAIRVQRRTEGWISGYSIKTKIYSRGGGIDDTAADAATTTVTNEESDAEYCDANSTPTTVDQTVVIEEDTTQQKSQSALTNEESDAEYCNANSTPTTVDQTVVIEEDTTQQKSQSQGYDSMCTICLLELEVGDCVADLSCGHLYHADCLGEWILKKVSAWANKRLLFWYFRIFHAQLTYIYKCRVLIAYPCIE